MVTKLPLATADDRVRAAMRSAPIVEATPEETAAFEEGLADIRAGRVVSAAQVQAELESREKE